MFRGLTILALLTFYASLTVRCQTVPAVQNLWRLEEQEDTDKDRRITVHDHITPFHLQSEQGRAVLTLSNVYELSVLLQELKRAEDRREVQVPVASLPLSENIVERTHRLIKDVYWDAL